MTSFNTHIIGQPRGNIAITAEEVADSKFDITMQLSGSNLDKKDFFGKVSFCIIAANMSVLFQSDPFFVVSKVHEGGDFTVVHRSQHILKTLNPKLV